jgi:hypothetical protein
MAKVLANAFPQKDFVIHQLTRDITLTDCILDLIDNTIDGVHNYFTRRQRSLSERPKPYQGYYARLRYSQNEFTIEDNCEGIPLKIATDYAFTFGRAPDFPSEAKGVIGQYGIGLNRAVFKLGDDIEIRSSTRSESFHLRIPVSKWAKEKDNWQFELIPGPPIEPAGTKIVVRDLKTEVKDEFAQSDFNKDLRAILARDYSFILPKGFELILNGTVVQPIAFKLKAGRGFRPFRTKFKHSGVNVDVIAGIAAPQPDDAEAGTSIPEQDRFGWFVICNDRVVIAGDKEKRTGWGGNGVPIWHPQYSGFFGVARMSSDDPGQLPWTTTKRDIELNSSVYQKTLAYMRQAAREYVKYTNLRKGSEEQCKKREADAPEVPIDKIPLHVTMEFPLPKKEKVEKFRSVGYKKPEKQFIEVAEALGNRSMKGKHLGEKTFDYFYEKKVGKLK